LHKLKQEKREKLNFSDNKKKEKMTEIYFNKTDDYIDELIKEKMEMYPSNIPNSKIYKLELPKPNFILDNYIRFYKLTGNYKIYRYLTMHNGIELYHFYNVVPV
jgi:hypothetical protein